MVEARYRSRAGVVALLTLILTALPLAGPIGRWPGPPAARAAQTPVIQIVLPPGQTPQAILTTGAVSFTVAGAPEGSAVDCTVTRYWASRSEEDDVDGCTSPWAVPTSAPGLYVVELLLLTPDGDLVESDASYVVAGGPDVTSRCESSLTSVPYSCDLASPPLGDDDTEGADDAGDAAGADDAGDCDSDVEGTCDLGDADDSGDDPDSAVDQEGDSEELLCPAGFTCVATVVSTVTGKGKTDTVTGAGVRSGATLTSTTSVEGDGLTTWITAGCSVTGRGTGAEVCALNLAVKAPPTAPGVVRSGSSVLFQATGAGTLTTRLSPPRGVSARLGAVVIPGLTALARTSAARRPAAGRRGRATGGTTTTFAVAGVGYYPLVPTLTKAGQRLLKQQGTLALTVAVDFASAAGGAPYHRAVKIRLKAPAKPARRGR